MGDFRVEVYVLGLDTLTRGSNALGLIPLRLEPFMRAHLILVSIVLLGLAPSAARADGRVPIGGYDWTGWVSRGGVAVSAPECVSGGGAGIACFVRGQEASCSWQCDWYTTTMKLMA